MRSAFNLFVFPNSMFTPFFVFLFTFMKGLCTLLRNKNNNYYHWIRYSLKFFFLFGQAFNKDENILATTFIHFNCIENIFFSISLHFKFALLR